MTMGKTVVIKGCLFLWVLKIIAGLNAVVLTGKCRAGSLAMHKEESEVRKNKRLTGRAPDSNSFHEDPEQILQEV